MGYGHNLLTKTALLAIDFTIFPSLILLSLFWLAWLLSCYCYSHFIDLRFGGIIALGLRVSAGLGTLGSGGVLKH